MMRQYDERKIMPSKIYQGFVAYERFYPVSHKFQYPVYCYGLDLDELPRIDQSVRFFGYNRRRPVSIHDRDYLDDRPGTIREKLTRILAEKKPGLSVTSVFMITSARYLNYVFNPVSFYYCFDPAGEVCAMAAEVNNTFGERHLYLPEKGSGILNADDPEKYYIDKAFHVSPFNDLEGRYEFSFPKPAKELDIRINLVRDGAVAFSARLWGAATELTSANLMKTMLRHPVAPHLTKPRIFLQAARLFFGKNLKYHNKPEPVSHMTIKRKS